MDQLNIFGADAVNPLFKDGLIEYVPQFFSRDESGLLFDDLKENIDWRQETLQIYGRQVKTPRLTAWYGDEGISYKYSGVVFNALPWTDALLQIKQKIEPLAGEEFNSVLLNLYRNGNDSMGWHSDDEPELGINPIIASVNFGQERRFDFRHTKDHHIKYSVNLSGGSVLVMKGNIQHNWQHQIAKTKKANNARINLTFRKIKMPAF
jgi:alkylated DNA repair dioxygenase AlkB